MRVGSGVCVRVCVYGTRLVSVRDASRVSSWCEYEDFEDPGGQNTQSDRRTPYRLVVYLRELPSHAYLPVPVSRPPAPSVASGS